VWKISIFLSPFDVHVHWVPTSGVVDRIVYTPGAFHPSFIPKSSELNERCDVHVRCDAQRRYIVRQIAGAIARRIICWVHEGDSLTCGDTYGMIRFGSRVELLLPANVHIDVGLGQYVYGGSTVIGRWV
jgi:phosphatidylserine decarboxylase